MKNKIIKRPFWKEEADIKNIFQIVGSDRLKFVGGAVRSAIARKHTLDIDLATNLQNYELKALLNKNKIKFYDFSKGHGTISIKLSNFNIEVTSLRIDKETYGRHAKVSHTQDYYLDSCRRDFTINAIYSDFNGKVYDPHKGIEDLQKSVVKFIGKPEQRIKEDKLRIIRYFRFLSTYTTKQENLDQKSLKACVQNFHKIKSVSLERINIELSKTITAKNAGFVFCLFKKYNLLRFLLEGLEIINKRDILLLDNLKKDELTRFAFLLIKSKNNPEDLKKKLKKSNKQIKELKALCSNVAPIKTGLDAKKLKYFYGKCIAKKKYDLNLILYKTDSNKSILKILNTWKVPKNPVNGLDLIDKGIKKSEINSLLKKIEKYWINRGFKGSKKECLKQIS